MQQSLTEILTSLQNLQQSDGSFLSYTNPTTKPITTTYYTSVILLCLEKIPESLLKESITSKGVQFLKNNQHTSGGWNYLANSEKTCYPNDLDDTFLALTAIHAYEPNFITPELLAQITNILIRTEVAPGGPYNTWICVDNSWNDLDIVVNANINSFLQKLNINLPNLNKYIQDKLNTSNLSSQYYHNPLVIHYFVTKNTTTAQELLKDIHNDSSYCFFIEKINDGITYYSTCPALVIALIIQASFTVEKKEILHCTRRDSLSLILSLLEKRSCNTPLIQAGLRNEITKLALSHSYNELFITQKFYDNLLQELKSTHLQESVQLLCLMTILGWIGFSIQDDIFDNQVDTSRLPIATSCILQTQEIIQEVLFGHSDANTLYEILHQINEVLLYEKTETTFTPKQITKKSAGLAIGPIILTHLLSIKNTYSEIKTIRDFFDNILAVKQVLDDCHDWQEDLARNTHTYITSKLLNRSSAPNNTIDLQQLFWKEIFNPVASTMLSWLTQAEQDAEKITILSDKKFLYDTVLYYRTAILRALRERTDSLAFFESYKKPPLLVVRKEHY